MRKFEYYSSLRKQILEVLVGVENSGWSLFWDETTPNWYTRKKLEKLYEKYVEDAATFGLYVVTRHCDCPNPDHSDFLISNSYGLSIVYEDENYFWDGGQMFQGNRYCICPCSSGNKITNHWIIEDVIYRNGSDFDSCKKLENILYDVQKSIRSAGNGKPRSAIRENLLRAVLRINDELLPEPMDLYIESKFRKNK